MDPTYPLVPIANFVACFLVLLSLATTLIKSRNVGAIMFAVWLAVVSFITGVNTVVWSDNVDDSAPVWCDITSHIIKGSVAGIPACSFVITRRLQLAIEAREIIISKKQRVYEVAFDIALTLGMPILTMILYYIVQGARYEIIEEIGCGTASYLSGVSILIMDPWYLIPPLVSALFYCPKISWVFYHRRKEVKEHLDSSAFMSRNSFYRFLAIGVLDAFIMLPVSLIELIGPLRQEIIDFWPGWSTIHSDWEPYLITADEWRASPWARFGIYWNSWINPAFSVIVFLLFGLTDEARANYRCIFCSCLKPFGCRPTTLARPELSAVIFESHAVSAASTGISSFSTRDPARLDGDNEAFTASSFVENGKLKSGNSAYTFPELGDSSEKDLQQHSLPDLDVIGELRRDDSNSP